MNDPPFPTNQYLYLIEHQVIKILWSDFVEWNEPRWGSQVDMVFVNLDLFFKTKFCKVL